MKQETKQNNFICKANKSHDNKFDYSLVYYQGPHIKVKILCPIHGEFEQTPDSHIRKHGCPKCNGGVKNTTNDFILQANLTHNNKYNYSNVNYINNTNKIDILCPIHGLFKQSPNNHLNGYGCNQCGVIKRKINKTKDTEYFTTLANKTHNNFYNYSNVNYLNNKTKVKIVCPIHGEFEQTPNDHISNKNGCPSCRESKGEKEIKRILKLKNIIFIQQKRFDDCRNIRPLPFDFYLPDYNVCIEYDGEQHYKNNSNFHKNISLSDIEKKDKIKTNYCDGINGKPKLIRIKYDEFNSIEKIIENIKCH